MGRDIAEASQVARRRGHDDVGDEGSFAVATSPDWVELNHAAADLSCGRFVPFHDQPLAGHGFERLEVLLLSGAPLQTRDLANVLQTAKSLIKLDISYCGIPSFPPAELWKSMLNLRLLIAHKNLLSKWADVERACVPPELEWLTMFDNPVTNQPEYRGLVLSWAPKIVAVDLRVVTDDERMEFDPALKPLHEQSGCAPWQPPSGHFRRFASNAHGSHLWFRDRPPPADLQLHPLGLMQEAWDELRVLRQRSEYCSAAFSIQGAWRIFKARVERKTMKADNEKGALKLQKFARKFLWKRSIQAYVKDFLSEVEELDLLLSAREMLTLRASKLVESAVRRWVQKRKDRRVVRVAAIIITRNVRGFLTRLRVLRSELQLESYPRIYFPASAAWEALALLNVARRSCHLPPLSRDYSFEAADVMAIRMPDMADLPRFKAVITRLLLRRNWSLLRPCHSGRYPGHLWDGPVHRLVDQTAPERICQAYKCVRRRSANVDTQCRHIFLRSCAPGPHPVIGSGSEGPLPGSLGNTDPREPDFRDLYSVGIKIGEGDSGIVFLCETRPGPAWDYQGEAHQDEGEEDETSAKESEEVAGSEEHTRSLRMLQEGRSLQLGLQQQLMERQQRLLHELDVPSAPAGYVVKLAEHSRMWWTGPSAKSPASHVAAWTKLAQELRVLSGLEHANIAKVHRVFVDDYFAYFVISRSKTSLMAAILNNARFSRKGLPAAVCEKVAGQLLAPLAYLHSHCVVHRGVKTENILLNTMELVKEPFTLILADLFSTARHLEAGVRLVDASGCDWPEYWAPEVVEGNYDHASDLWAAGVVLFFALMKKLPFASLKDALTEDLEEDERLPEAPFDLLCKLLSRVPEERVSAAEAQTHGWFGGLDEIRTGHRSSDDDGSAVESPTMKSKTGVTGPIAPTRPGGAANRKLGNRGSTFDISGRTRTKKKEYKDEIPANWGRPNQTARSLVEKKTRADERYALGEKVTVRLKVAIQRRTVSLAGAGSSDSSVSGGQGRPFESYEWWSDERCRSFGLDPGDAHCPHPFWRPPSHGGSEAAATWDNLLYVHPISHGDIDQLMEENSLNAELATAVAEPVHDHVPLGQARSRARTEGSLLVNRSLTREDRVLEARIVGRSLLNELNAGRCRLCIDGGRLCRVTDHLVLRISNAEGQLLVGGLEPEQQEEDGDEEDPEADVDDLLGPVPHSTFVRRESKAASVMIATLQHHRTVRNLETTDVKREWKLPSIAFLPARLRSSEGVGGVSELQQALHDLVWRELRTSPETLHYSLFGSSEEVCWERSESIEHRGILELRRWHYFDATIRKDANHANLSQIGFGQQNFETTRSDAKSLDKVNKVLWSWMDAESCAEQGIQVGSDVAKHHEHLGGFQPVPEKQLDAKPLAALLQKHGFLREAFVASRGPLQTTERFAGEVARGQIRLCIKERPPDPEPPEPALLPPPSARRRSSAILSASSGGALATAPLVSLGPLGVKPRPDIPGKPAPGAGELRIMERVLILRVCSSRGHLLVKTQKHVQSDSQGHVVRVSQAVFPETKVRPGEDPLDTARRLLQRSLRLTSAHAARIHFGAPRVEELPAVISAQTSMSMRGMKSLATLCVRQVVDVQLSEADVTRLCGIAMPWQTLQEDHEASDVDEVPVSRMLQDLVEGPGMESNGRALGSTGGEGAAGTAVAAAMLAAEKDAVLAAFLQEAWRLGSRLPKPKPKAKAAAGHGIVADPKTGRRIYRDAVWLLQPMLCCRQSPRVTERFVKLLLRFAGTGGDAPLVRPFAFLPERFAKQASAAIRLQAAFRAHRERCSLACGLRTAAVLRRSALCIQRCWRWSILKRRLELLTGACRAAQAVRGTSFYIEERLLLALNLVNGANRYAPLLRESGLCFGYTVEDDVVLVKRGRSRFGSAASSDSTAEEDPKAKAARRTEFGLPTWLGAKVCGELRVLSADDPQLVTQGLLYPGLSGLLLQGIAEPQEKDIITVSMPSLDHAARLAGKTMSAALLASSGQLRWAELRFKSVAQARKRCLMLFLCTFSALHREAVPFLTKAVLGDTQVGLSVIRFWHIYGLSWAPSEKTVLSRLRQKVSSASWGLAPMCGRDSWAAIFRQDWMLLDRYTHERNSRPSSQGNEAKSAAQASATGLTCRGGLLSLSGIGHVAAKGGASNPGSALPPLALQ
ncbi:unnamed protein product, partial [Polarella glacialis]